jgi:hypothetical protein
MEPLTDVIDAEKIVVQELETFIYHVKQLIYFVWEQIVCRYLDDNNINGTLYLGDIVSSHSSLLEISLVNNQITSADYGGSSVENITTVVK